MIGYLFNSGKESLREDQRTSNTYWFDDRLRTIRPLAFSISFGSACKWFRLRSRTDKSGLSNNRAEICVWETWLSLNDNDRNEVKSFTHSGTSWRWLWARLSFSYEERTDRCRRRTICWSSTSDFSLPTKSGKRLTFVRFNSNQRKLHISCNGTGNCSLF